MDQARRIGRAGPAVIVVVESRLRVWVSVSVGIENKSRYQVLSVTVSRLVQVTRASPSL